MELFRDRDSWQKPIEPRTETDRAIVTAKVDRHLRCVQLPREDTGVGISGEDRGKLFPGFEPWGARQRKARETGLELAISQQILQLMGEQSQVESELGWGSTFEVEVALPAVMNWVRQRSLDRGRKILGYEGVCRHLPIFDDRRVLVFRTVLIHLLESLGFEIDRVQNRCQGIENLLNQYSIEVDRRG
ncbi:MAG: ATP-binding protein [Cyanobacteriota bacterium]|nr:ATP-binding protein [Cyanobacteriota bacterium]